MKKNLTSKKYPSGACLMLEQDKNATYASFAFKVNAGAMNETPEQFGVAHFLEHMFFKSTTNRSTQQIAQTLEGYGARINAYTSEEDTTFVFKCLNEYLEKCIEVYADMLKNPLLDPDELEKERQVVLEEIDMYEDSARSVACDASATVLMSQVLPNAHFITGSKADVKGLTRQNLVDFKTKHYVGSNITISVYANLNFDQTEKIITKYFGEFLTQTSKPNQKPQTLPLTPQKKVQAITKDAEQVNLYIRFFQPSYQKDEYIFAVFNHIFGRGTSSRLWSLIREENGFAYTVAAYNSSSRLCGMETIYMGVNPQNLKAAIQMVNKILLDMATKPVLQEELSRAKIRIKSSLAFNADDKLDVVEHNARDYLAYGAVRSPDEIAAAVDAVTAQDVLAFAQKFYQNTTASVVATGKNVDENILKIALERQNLSN